MNETNEKSKFEINSIVVFGVAFYIFALCILPSLFMTKGIWIYYGDFNVQQIPFYIHIHDAIRSGNFFYDWGTDLGGSLIGCYSFYLLGSPFFWLSIPFPSAAVPYLIPWINALKYATMALFAYRFLLRHVRTKNAAFFGALLYAFSGFQGAVLVYNHFHDVMAFFPLYLMTFENLIEEPREGKKGRKVLGFIFMTSLMLIINYYFFVGEAVFLVLYYVAKYVLDGDILIKEKILGVVRAFFCGLAGVLLTGVYIIPAVYYTLGNGRLSELLSGYDLVAYSEPTMLWGIIKNVVLLPDVSGLNSMLNAGYSRVSGIGAYIPLFSVAGVIAFFLYNKEKVWEKRVLTASLIFAVIPAFNALFSALNSEYYARWYYMPILIMALATARMLEDRQQDEMRVPLTKGVRFVAIVDIAIAIISVLPTKKDDGTWTVLGALKNYEQLVVELIFSFVMLALLIAFARFFYKKSDATVGIIIFVACIATTATMLYMGTSLVDKDRKTDFVAQALKSDLPISDTDEFFRYETDEDFYNYPLIWEGSHCITSFISTIPDSTLDFYNAGDVRRKVTSNLPVARVGMRALLSGKYFVTNSKHSIEYIGHIDTEELKGYTLKYSENGFNIFENENYIPMGIVFDYYITTEEFETHEFTTSAKDRLFVRALVLDSKDAARYDSIMIHADPVNFETTTYDTFVRICNARRESACTEFKTSTYGFTAKANMASDNLVLFTVPYETGFTAYVDGKETPIIKADYGFMAVKVPAGEHDIEFKYSLSGLKEGIYMSVAGLALLILIVVITYINKRRKVQAETIEVADEIIEDIVTSTETET